MERQRQPPVKDNWEDMTEEDWAKQILYLQNLPPVTPPEEDEWDKADREEEERLAKQEREKGEDFERFKALSAECEKVRAGDRRTGRPEGRAGQPARRQGAGDERHPDLGRTGPRPAAAHAA